MNEFLKRNATRVVAKNRASLYPENYRRHIIETANNRGFYVSIHGRMVKAKIGGIKRNYPQVIAGNTILEISWRVAENLANGLVRTLNY